MPHPLHLVTDLLRQPRPVQAWVIFMMLVNCASVLFWSEPLARVILAVFLVSAMLLMLLHARFGYSGLLGLAHVLWIPLLPVLLWRLPSAAGAFQGYLVLLSVVILVSLLLDVRDVWRHVRSGQALERQRAVRGNAADR